MNRIQQLQYEMDALKRSISIHSAQGEITLAKALHNIYLDLKREYNKLRGIA